MCALESPGVTKQTNKDHIFRIHGRKNEQTSYLNHLTAKQHYTPRGREKHKASDEGRNIIPVVINKLDLAKVKLCSPRTACNIGNVLTPYY